MYIFTFSFQLLTKMEEESNDQKHPSGMNFLVALVFTIIAALYTRRAIKSLQQRKYVWVQKLKF